MRGRVHQAMAFPSPEPVQTVTPTSHAFAERAARQGVSQYNVRTRGHALVASGK